ncbi:hypothetical protein [Thiolapillus sp.]|uniref:hypothetical protein n=1 Tax=Thiolapillus sp. TaxID=2017437 RepID=UPI003AF50738
MFSLWRKARRENSAASRLLGSTSLRFALHGWQRMSSPTPTAGCSEPSAAATADRKRITSGGLLFALPSCSSIASSA